MLKKQKCLLFSNLSTHDNTFLIHKVNRDFKSNILTISILKRKIIFKTLQKKDAYNDVLYNIKPAIFRELKLLGGIKSPPLKKSFPKYLNSYDFLKASKKVI